MDDEGSEDGLDGEGHGEGDDGQNNDEGKESLPKTLIISDGSDGWRRRNLHLAR